MKFSAVPVVSLHGDTVTVCVKFIFLVGNCIAFVHTMSSWFNFGGSSAGGSGDGDAAAAALERYKPAVAVSLAYAGLLYAFIAYQGRAAKHA